MQYIYAINSSFTVTSLLDLPMLRDILEACNLKPNYSLLGRELGYDRRTIKSHYENGMPDPHRHKPSMIDKFYDIIKLIGKRILNSYYMMAHTIQEVEERKR